MKYNEEHGITPQTSIRSTESVFDHKDKSAIERVTNPYQRRENEMSIAADPVMQYMSADGVKKAIENTKTQMLKAAKEMDFMEAARLRDEMNQLEDKLKGMK
jgi:excinuclease ABC subunit B